LVGFQGKVGFKQVGKKGSGKGKISLYLIETDELLSALCPVGYARIRV
jgi:hypothetical protein